VRAEAEARPCVVCTFYHRVRGTDPPCDRRLVQRARRRRPRRPGGRRADRHGHPRARRGRHRPPGSRCDPAFTAGFADGTPPGPSTPRQGDSSSHNRTTMPGSPSSHANRNLMSCSILRRREDFAAFTPSRDSSRSRPRPMPRPASPRRLGRPGPGVGPDRAASAPAPAARASDPTPSRFSVPSRGASFFVCASPPTTTVRARRERSACQRKAPRPGRRTCLVPARRA
jgi:hypothetical protein